MSLQERSGIIIPKSQGSDVLTEQDDFIAIDIDDCVKNPSLDLQQGALEIIQSARSYAEYSPSGTGIHIYVLGEIPRQGWVTHQDGFKIEIFDKYFTTVSEMVLNSRKRVCIRNQEFVDDLFSEFEFTWDEPKFTSFWPDR